MNNPKELGLIFCNNELKYCTEIEIINNGTPKEYIWATIINREERVKVKGHYSKRFKKWLSASTSIYRWPKGGSNG